MDNILHLDNRTASTLAVIFAVLQLLPSVPFFAPYTGILQAISYLAGALGIHSAGSNAANNPPPK